MEQIKSKQMAYSASTQLALAYSQETEDADKGGFNQLVRNVSGRLLHFQSPHVSSLLHICSLI